MVQADTILTVPSPAVLVICGPTASGKSNIALMVAQQLRGEIICMDSMQIYDKMDIGTAKPTVVERDLVPHHLFGNIPPSAPYSVAMYREDALRKIDEVLARGNLPILVGGTGLYLRSLRYDYLMGSTGEDEVYRAQLEQEAQTDHGKERLHQRLSIIDSVTAHRLHPNDMRRVIRALEIAHTTGMPMSQQLQAGKTTRYDFRVVGITMDRATLYNRINQRVLQMIEDGLVDEVKSLLNIGVSPVAQSMQGIGYKEVASYLHKEVSLEGCIALIQQNTRHYAKRQWTWFRREEGIIWLDSITDDPVARIINIMEKRD